MQEKLQINIEKHEKKLAAHREAREVLENELAKEAGNKRLAIEDKIASTIQRIEYHRGALKAYSEVEELF